MTGIGVYGCNGRMGRTIIEAIHLDGQVALACAVARKQSPWQGMDAGELAGIGKLNIHVTESMHQGVDNVIDFTLPEALMANLDFCVAKGTPMVIGTTGLSADQKKRLESAATSIPIVFAANYSVGVNLMLNLVKQAAKVMGKTSDIEIVETHHRFKKDAPSGTAVAIGEAIADELGRDLNQCAVYGREGDTGERQRDTIGFATVRAGDVVGDHTALFADLGERLEISHKASSRLTFAKGAVTASKWLVGKPAGLYSMQDVLGL